jgi:hypothetical protein
MGEKEFIVEIYTRVSVVMDEWKRQSDGIFAVTEPQVDGESNLKKIWLVEWKVLSLYMSHFINSVQRVLVLDILATFIINRLWIMQINLYNMLSSQKP